MSEAPQPLPVVVGAARGRLPGDRGDQLVYGDANSDVVVYAAAPIPGVVLSEHRPCLLVIDEVKWRVDFVERDGDRHVYRCSAWRPGPYEREGAVVGYDPERVHRARVERLSTSLRVALLIVFLPLLPLAGLLPLEHKEALRERGLLPHGGQTGSIAFQWLVLLCLVAAELICILAEALVPAVVCGACALILLVDVLHRIVLAGDGNDVGMLSWVRQLGRTFTRRDDASARADDGDRTPRARRGP